MGLIMRGRKCYTGKVRDKSQYSTDEVFTGDYWIDGKPIYRRVYSDTGTFSGYVTLDTTISKTNIIPRKISEVYQVSSGAYVGKTDYYVNGARGFSAVALNTKLEIQNNISIIGYTVVIEYTKTTD